MKQHIRSWQLAGFFFTSFAGTLLHFLFDWSGENIVVALFSAVNESNWEHIKLLFYPMFLFAGIEHYFLGKEMQSFWCIKLKGALLGFVLIPAIYYSYTGMLGLSSDLFNVLIFFITAGIVYYMETKLLEKNRKCRFSSRSAFIFLCLIVLLFTLLTFSPPQIPFFRDPVHGTYGY